MHDVKLIDRQDLYVHVTEEMPPSCATVVFVATGISVTGFEKAERYTVREDVPTLTEEITGDFGENVAEEIMAAALRV